MLVMNIYQVSRSHQGIGTYNKTYLKISHSISDVPMKLVFSLFA